MEDGRAAPRDADAGLAMMGASAHGDAGGRAVTSHEELGARELALRLLIEHEVPVVVGGAYAFFEYTGIHRATKDLDLMLRRRDVPAAFAALESGGFRTHLLDPAWIGKAYAGRYYIDLIFNSGNGVIPVDDPWFEHAVPATVMGQRCLIAPVEELIWSKAFVNERERFDGADVNHLVFACGDRVDWKRLLDRFAGHWEVLLAHVSLYRFTYPSARSKVPEWLIRELCRRTEAELADVPEHICRGNLISRTQYRFDYERLGFGDGRAARARRRRTARAR